MTTFLACLVLVVVAWWLRPAREGASADTFTPRRLQALKLAEPMVQAAGITGFYNVGSLNMAEEGRVFLRASLIHQMGYRSDATDAQVSEHMQAILARRWFRMDLDSLKPADDPRAALAFACVRVAFLLRCAMLMEWVTPDATWPVLLLNAQRAQDCFDSWDDLGHAYLTGRRQWVQALRADGLGKGFDQACLDRLLAVPGGEWADLPWHRLVMLHPVAKP